MQIHHKSTFRLPFKVLVSICFLLGAINNAQAQMQKPMLPPCKLDSFVREAGGKAEDIYGDESVGPIPPFFGYTPEHRIDSGIQGISDVGLTTGHGSIMPAAVGADEFLGQEWVNTAAHGLQNRGLDTPQEGLDLTGVLNQYEAARNQLIDDNYANNVSGLLGVPNKLQSLEQNLLPTLQTAESSPFTY